MLLKAMSVGMFASNCYLVGCSQTGEGAVVDPGAEGKKIVQEINRMGLQIKYIINTHGHVDHVGANGVVKAATGAKILLHRNDLDLYQRPMFGLSLVQKSPPLPDTYMEEGTQITLGQLTMSVTETPGHTQGGVSLVLGSAVFTGDTLFAGSIGRTDMKGGSYSQIIHSIEEKLMVFPDDTIIYPGHGPASTIGDERRYNPFL